MSVRTMKVVDLLSYVHHSGTQISRIKYRDPLRKGLTCHEPGRCDSRPLQEQKMGFVPKDSETKCKLAYLSSSRLVREKL